MSKKSRKRARDDPHDEIGSGESAKRKRQSTDAKLELSKLYEDLAAETDETRLKAAEQLILRFTPQNNPSAHDVQEVLNRLVRGLCTQRKAARLGFCVTLTELLRQLLGKQKIFIDGLELDVDSLLKRIDKQTKVEGNASGMVRHIIDNCQSKLMVIPRNGGITSLGSCSHTRQLCNREFYLGLSF
jgi:DNA polymerase phi